jgi:hypothetical protein
VRVRTYRPDIQADILTKALDDIAEVHAGEEKNGDEIKGRDSKMLPTSYSQTPSTSGRGARKYARDVRDVFYPPGPQPAAS